MSNKHPLVGAMPLFLVIFIDGAGLGLVFPILNSILLDPRVSILAAGTSHAARTLDYGIVTGVFMLCWFFGAAIVSDLSDVVGRKRALLICLVGAFIGYFLSGLAIYFHSLSLLILGRIIAGFTAGSQPVAQASVIDVSPEHKKASFLGYTLLAVSLGFVIGPIAGGLLSDNHLVSWFNFTLPMYFASLISFINILLLLWLYKETFVPTKKIKIRPQIAISLFISAFRDKKVRVLSISFFVFLLGWANFFTYASLFALGEYHFPAIETTLLMAVMGLGFAVGMGFLTKYVERWFGLKKGAIIGLFLTVVFILLILVVHHPWSLWIFTAPAACFASNAYVLMITIFSNHVESDRQGWVMGITGALMALGFAITSFVSGFFSDLSPAVPFWIALVVMFISALTLIPQRFSKKDLTD